MVVSGVPSILNPAERGAWKKRLSARWQRVLLPNAATYCKFLQSAVVFAKYNNSSTAVAPLPPPALLPCIHAHFKTWKIKK